MISGGAHLLERVFLFLATSRALALLSLGLKVDCPLFLRLVQAIDYLVLALLNVEALHEPVVVKRHGAYGHIARFLHQRKSLP